MNSLYTKQVRRAIEHFVEFSDRIDAGVEHSAYGRAVIWFKRRPVVFGVWSALLAGSIFFVGFKLIERISGDAPPPPSSLFVVPALVSGIGAGLRTAWELRKERTLT